MHKLIRILAIAIGLLTVLAVAASFHPEVQNIRRALSASEEYDTEPPIVPADLAEPAILIFTKTNGYRHSEAIDAGIPLFQRIATDLGGSSFATENSAVFTPDLLSRFQVVVFHNASGAPLDEVQRGVLRNWIEAGGGFIGVHAALDDSHKSWEWYQRQLVGAKFIGHIMGPQFQTATLRVEQPGHPAMTEVPTEWPHIEEWYSFESSVRGQPGVEVLATVDESTYTPRMKFLWTDKDLAMGDHPVIWTREIGKGRGFFTALGHAAAAYATPEYQGILRGATTWAAGAQQTVHP